jgi:hypothetical protein
MKRSIYLYCSEIASYIGQNKWDYVTPFERLWKRCDSECYRAILDRMEENINITQNNIKELEEKKNEMEENLKKKLITKSVYNKEKKKLEEEYDKKQMVIKKMEENVEEIKLDQKQKLEKVMGKQIIEEIKVNDLGKNNDVISKAIENLDISKEKKKVLIKEAESFVNKTHGTKTEVDAITMFEQKFKIKLDTSQEFHKKYLSDFSKDSAFDWYICGKLDGVYMGKDEKYIVEVKNRTKAFFTTLRDYEKTQIHLYMYMLDINKAKLVEKYKEKIRITDIYENKDYTDDVIKYLGIFIGAFERNFLDVFEKKCQYVESSLDEKKVILKQLYLSNIAKMIDEKIEQEDQDCLIDDLD